MAATICLFQGITYDTGGADVKAGGHMAGMHRDKCGAAFVAGFFKVHVVTQILLSTTTGVRPYQCHQNQECLLFSKNVYLLFSAQVHQIKAISN